MGPQTGKLKETLQGLSSNIQFLSFLSSTRNSGLTAIDLDGHLLVWSIKQDKSQIIPQPIPCGRIVFTTTAHFVAAAYCSSGDSQPTAQVVIQDNYTGGTQILDAGNTVVNMTFNADESLLATSGCAEGIQDSSFPCENINLLLWEIPSGKQVAALTGHTGWVWQTAFSPDGALLASAGGKDQTVRVWDTQKGEPLATLQTDETSITRVAFSPDGSMIASAGLDGIIRLWGIA